MNHDFWNERWENNQIGFHRTVTNRFLEAHWQRITGGKEGPVFVPLCGKSYDLIWLEEQGHAVTGVELSEIAVRDFFAEHDLTPVIDQVGALKRSTAGHIQMLEGDFFELEAAHLPQFEFFYDRAALIALPAPMRDVYAEALLALLPANATGLLITLDYDQSEMAGPPFAVSEEEVQHHFGERFTIGRLADEDVLYRHPHFAARGLTALRERAYHLAV